MILEVECKAKQCDNCEWRCGLFCHLFEHDVPGSRRCAACLKAEAKAKGMSK